MSSHALQNSAYAFSFKPKTAISDPRDLIDAATVIRITGISAALKPLLSRLKLECQADVIYCDFQAQEYRVPIHSLNGQTDLLPAVNARITHYLSRLSEVLVSPRDLVLEATSDDPEISKTEALEFLKVAQDLSNLETSESIRISSSADEKNANVHVPLVANFDTTTYQDAVEQINQTGKKEEPLIVAVCRALKLTNQVMVSVSGDMVRAKSSTIQEALASGGTNYYVAQRAPISLKGFFLTRLATPDEIASLDDEDEDDGQASMDL